MVHWSQGFSTSVSQPILKPQSPSIFDSFSYKATQPPRSKELQAHVCATRKRQNSLKNALRHSEAMNRSRVD